MSKSISETGVAINISNFKLLIDKCTGFTDYNPSATKLSIVNMTALWTTADAANTAENTALMNSKNPINAREILFAPSDALITKSMNYFKSTDASSQVKKDAKGLADRFRGFGTNVPKDSSGKPLPGHISTSHQSYVQKQNTLQQLIALYASDPNYAPNENDITITALSKLSDDMKKANDNVGGILSPVENARMTTDSALNAPNTGILDVAEACKNYVKGVYGALSPEAKTVTGIKFRRNMK